MSRYVDFNGNGFKFTLDTQNVRTEILQSDWMLKYVTEKASQENKSGKEIVPFIGFDRAKAIIK